MKRFAAALAQLMLVLPTGVCAAARESIASLGDLTLEQLTQVKVTSAARREERLSDTPVALYVITRDDIRRSGATSLPEALRLAPNLQVARADTNQYAISARGFNNTLANKMLVMIDGRIVYSPLFSGVFWDAQVVMLEDVERIEVISGPGSTLWGTNAVNGVISIITLPAGETQGTLAWAGGGNRERGVAARFGGALSGEAHYRGYLSHMERDGSRTADGAELGDDSRRVSGGFRADLRRGRDAWTLQADAYRGDVERSPEREFSGASVLGRWTRELDAGSAFAVQAYFDHTRRRHQNTFREKLDTLDVEFQHTWKRIPAHTVVWGGGHRRARDDLENSAAQAFVPPDRSLAWTSVFVQDRWAITPSLAATLGLKVERNPYTGNEWLPDARLAWHPTPRQLVWASVSRAVRAPSRLDRELFFPGVPPFQLAGNSTFASEVARIGELGYRVQATDALSGSVTLFRHDYPNLRSIRREGAWPIFANDIEGEVEGVEAWFTWRADRTFRLNGGFVSQRIDQRVKPGRVDLGGITSLGNDPRRWAMLRAAWTPHPQFDVDAAVRYVGALQRLVPSYTAIDARIAWRPMPRLELSLTATNAAGREYFEWQNRVLNERAVFFKAEWTS